MAPIYGGTKTWGPLKQPHWYCTYCDNNLDIRVCRTSTSPHYGRLYVVCHPFRNDELKTEIHPKYYRWCNDAMPSPSASHLRAMSVPPYAMPVTASSSSGRSVSQQDGCAISGCAVRRRVSKGCSRGYCPQHCALAGGCKVHMPAAHQAFLQLGLLSSSASAPALSETCASTPSPVLSDASQMSGVGPSCGSSTYTSAPDHRKHARESSTPLSDKVLGKKPRRSLLDCFSPSHSTCSQCEFSDDDREVELLAALSEETRANLAKIEALSPAPEQPTPPWVDYEEQYQRDLHEAIRASIQEMPSASASPEIPLTTDLSMPSASSGSSCALGSCSSAPIDLTLDVDEDLTFSNKIKPLRRRFKIESVDIDLTED
ncbi:hypothetical protein C8Q73DRAFT_407637 [Cubamyces lactineus]|nr:hypothetical protein C8Q73DRAFT_407637 [Cubamyces lactineus]